LKDTSFLNISRVMMKYADGINIASENLDASLQQLVDEQTCLKQEFVPEENQTKVLSEFFDKVIEEEILI
jgi:hypothetical protein